MEKTMNRIPKLNEFRVPADPGDPSSRESFLPYTFKLQYKGTGGYILSHKGTGEDLKLDTAEIVFLYTSPATECQCKKTADKGNLKAPTVCRTTDNRRLSFKGYLCFPECPYAEPGVAKEQKKYSRPLSKMVLVLVKHPTSGAFVIARYYGGLDRVKEYTALHQKFKMVLPSKSPDKPYPTANIARLTATVLEMANGSSGRFGGISWVETLTDEETAAVAELIKEVTEMYEAKLARDQEYSEKVRKEREEREKLTGVKEDPTLEGKPDPDKAPPAFQKPDPTAGATSQESAPAHEGNVSKPSAEDVSAAVNDLTVDDDDDLPF